LRDSLLIIFILSTTVVFAQQSKRVFNLDNPSDTAYRYKAGILEHYANCRSEDEDSISYQKFLQGLQPINSQLIHFIRQENFNFKTKDSSILIMHKYHVNSKGEIKYCSFMTHSELSKRTKRRYAKLLNKFIEDRKVNYESETPFSICGQSRFYLKNGKLKNGRSKKT
jgi:hypothetical protein